MSQLEKKKQLNGKIGRDIVVFFLMTSHSGKLYNSKVGFAYDFDIKLITFIVLNVY